MPRRRALYLLFHYPSITEAYVEAEIRAVSHADEVFVIATDAHPTGVTPYRLHSPYRVIPDRAAILEAIQNYRPHVIHAHRLFMFPVLAPICAELGIPFTVRSHAHDAIPSSDPRVAGWMQQAPQLLPGVTSSRLCLGILAFPFTRRHLEGWGVPHDKIYDCYPVVDFSRFHDPSPNGNAVVNAGSYMPKKNMEAFLELGRRLPQLTFNLYALSSRLHNIEELKEKNRALGYPVNVMDPVQPEDMLREYKKAQWMVYTADPVLANVGWPVSIAEAQAAGVGVCMANIRPDLRDYVGDTGFLYDSLAEVEQIITKPFEVERRVHGFEQAKKSDVFVHRDILLNLWDAV